MLRARPGNSLSTMTLSEEPNLCFTIVDKPFNVVAPAAIGVARALWGQMSVHQHDTRRPLEIKSDQAARLPEKRLLFAQTGMSISSTPKKYTLIEDPLFVQVTRSISAVLPDAQLLGIESWTEDKVRVCQRMSFYLSGQRLRCLGAHKGTNASGWAWQEEGTPTPWEDPVVLGARRISSRLTRPELFAIARRFGVDIEAAIAAPAKRAVAVEFLDLYDPAAPSLVSDDHMDCTRRAVELGIGDAMHLEPPDFEGAAQLDAEEGSARSQKLH